MLIFDIVHSAVRLGPRGQVLECFNNAATSNYSDTRAGVVVLRRLAAVVVTHLLTQTVQRRVSVCVSVPLCVSVSVSEWVDNKNEVVDA